MFSNLEEIDVVVLCGGLGTRLRPVHTGQKVLAKLGDQTCLDLIINCLKKWGFKKIILSTGYQREEIKRYFSQNEQKEYTLHFSEEETPLGTGGAVKKAKEHITSDRFLVMNGDSICRINFKDFIDFHKKKNALLSIALGHIESPEDFGSVVLTDSHQITHFREKVEDGSENLINAGAYIMEKGIFQLMPEQDRFSLERDLFPALAAANGCYGFLTQSRVIDIGTPERYNRAIEILKQGGRNNKMKIAFGDLKIGKTAKKYLQNALDKNWASEGANVKEFEEKFAAHFGYKHAIAVSSGTDADICACASLYAFGANRGDEIITPALSFVACPNSILAAGFTPKFVDIELETLNIDPSKIEEAITEKTCAIMAVHTMGKPCDMDKINAIAKKHGLKVIEDSCEALGGTYNNRPIGTIGDMGAFSFYAAHLVVCGEGGMVVTNDDHIAEVVRSVKSHGRPAGDLYFDFQRIGFNSKMNDFEAALGLENLEKVDETFKTRKDNLNILLNLLEEFKDRCFFIKEENHENVSPHAFPLVLKDEKHDRDALYTHLESKGIQCKTLFGSLPTQHNAFKFLGYKPGQFPVAELVGKTGLHFGIHQYLTQEHLVHVRNCMREYFKNFS